MALSEARPAAEVDSPPLLAGAAGTLRQETLDERAIEGGLALSDAAGWNQTGDDWALFIRHGQAIGLRDGAGRWVATAASLPYGGERGYVSMVLVDPAWRHRGLAGRLLGDAVARLRGAGIVPMLDATPAGAAVYRQSGFVDGFEIDRWELGAFAPGAERSPDGVLHPAAGLDDLDALAALDRDATGLDRRFLLAAFLSRPDTRAWRSGDGHGFAIVRAGRRATQVGPLVAAGPGEAATLLDAALAAAAATGRPVFLDLPRAHRFLAERLERLGFTRQRSFVRMSLGASEAPRLRAGMFVLAGPEFG